MSKAVKYGLIITACNIGGFLLLIPFADKMNMDAGLFLLLVLPAIVLLIELILGIIFAATSVNKDLGSGLLLGVGLTLLIGLGVCGIISNF